MANSIYNDYLAQNPIVTELFKYPLHPDWEKVCKDVLNHYTNHTFLKELIEQNQSCHDPTVQKNLSLLEQSNTVIVITGQQLGLFISPLYTLYKTLTTILLTRKLNTQLHQYHFIPVFWLEAEDHDFAEVNQARFFNKLGSLVHFEYPENPEQYQYSISKRYLSPAIVDILTNLRSELQDTEFTAPLFERLQQLYPDEGSWIDAFAGHLRMLFEGFGLLLFNPASPKVKFKSKGFFQKLIERNDKINLALADQSDYIKNLGYPNQVMVDPDKSYIFLSYQGTSRRHLLRRKSGYFYFKDLPDSFKQRDLIEILERNPDWFSSSVLTRPIWQSWMLPVVSCVAGPSEISYWSQLKRGFEELEVIMPNLRPRLTLTLLEPKVQRLLGKYKISPDQIEAKIDNFIQKQIKKQQSPGMESEFLETKKLLIEHKQRIQRQVEEIDPTLQSLIQKTFENVEETLNRLESRILKRIEEKEELLLKNLTDIHTSIYPEGQLQERYISSLYFFNKYGHEWFVNLTRSVDLEKLNHQVISL